MTPDKLKDGLKSLANPEHSKDKLVLSYHGLSLSSWFQEALDYIESLENKVGQTEINRNSEPLTSPSNHTVSTTLNVDDTIIYLPWWYDNNSGIAKLLLIGISFDKQDIEFTTDFESDDIGFATLYNNGIFYLSEFNRVWFMDEGLANEKLKELQSAE